MPAKVKVLNDLLVKNGSMLLGERILLPNKEHLNREKDFGAASLLMTDQWVNSIEESLKNIKYDIDMYFYSDNIGTHKKKGLSFFNLMEHEKFINLFPHLHVPKPDENKITIVYTHNMTSEKNYKPFTAWITIHRLMHVVDMYGSGEKRRKFVNTDKFDDWAYDIYKKLYEPKEIRLYTSFLSSILTTKCARMKTLNTSADAYAEIGTQFMLKGDIIFNDLPEEVEGFVTNNFSNTTYLKKTIRKKNTSWADEILKEKREELISDFTQNLENIKGKICMA